VDGSATFSINIQDLNTNPVAAGSTVTVGVANSADATVSPGSFKTGCSVAFPGVGQSYVISVSGVTAGSTAITVTVTSPGTGTVSSPLYIPLTVS
jgi:hypothetical protein